MADEPKKEAATPTKARTREDIDKLYHQGRLGPGEEGRSNWIALRREAADKIEITPQKLWDTMKKVWQENLTEAQEQMSPANRTKLQELPAHQAIPQAMLGDALAIIKLVATIPTTVSRSLNEPVSHSLVRLGVDPAKADKAGNVLEFIVDVATPIGGGLAGITYKGYKGIQAAKTAGKVAQDVRTAKTIGKILGGVDEVTEAAGVKVAKAAEAGEPAFVKGEKSKKAAETLRKMGLEEPEAVATPAQAFEEAMRGFFDQSASVSARIKAVLEPLPRDVVALEAQSALRGPRELFVSPEMIARGNRAFTETAKDLTKEWDTLVKGGVKNNDFIGFMSKLYHFQDQLPDAVELSATASRSLGEMRYPTTVMTEHIREFTDYLSDLAKVPVTGDSIAAWKTVIMDELRGLFEGPDAAMRVTGFMESVTKAGGPRSAKGMVREYAVLNMISSPMTAGRNLTGGVSILATKGVAAHMGSVTGRVMGDKRYPIDEMTHWWYGLAKGGEAAWQTLTVQGWDEFLKLAGSKMDHESAFKGPVLGTYRLAATGMLSLGDGFLRSMGRHAHIYSTAALVGRKAGKVGDELEQFVADYVKHVPPSVMREAKGLGDEVAAQGDLGPLGKALNLTRTALDDMSAWFSVGTLLLPFIKAPATLGRILYEHGPVTSMVARKTFADLNSGDPKRIADTLGRVYLAHGASAMAFAMAASGQITGDGPADPGLRAQWIKNGWQPRHIFGHNFGVETSGFSPLTEWMVWHANLYELAGSGELKDLDGAKLAHTAYYLTMNMFKDINFTQQWGRVIDASRLGPVEMAKEVGRIGARMLVPFSGALSFTERAFDPEIREVAREAFIAQDQIREFIPGLSKSLKPLLDWRGRKVYNNNLIDPDTTNDPITQKLNSLGVSIKAPDRYLYGSAQTLNALGERKPESVPYELSTDEWTDFQLLAGVRREKRIGALINSPTFTNQTEPMQRAMIEAEASIGLNEGQRALYTQHPKLLPAINQHLLNRTLEYIPESKRQEFRDYIGSANEFDDEVGNILEE